MFRNSTLRRYVEVGRTSGPAFAAEDVGSGLAVGNIDNDGDSHDQKLADAKRQVPIARVRPAVSGLIFWISAANCPAFHPNVW